METARDKRDSFFQEYFDSIFKSANAFSRAEYDKFSEISDLNCRAVLPKRLDAEILDIGCGTGHFLYYLNKRGYTRYMGVDVSPEQVSFCREHISEHVVLMDASEFLRSRENEYDAIVANDFLEHVPKDQMIDLLRLVRQALTDQGTFIIRTPNMSNPLSLCARYRDFTHETGFTETSLYQVLYVAGFRNIRIHPLKPYPEYSPKRYLHTLFSRMIYYGIRKAMQLHGISTPQIMDLRLMAISQKDPEGHTGPIRQETSSR